MKMTSRTILAAAFALLLPACLAFASPAHAQTQPASPWASNSMPPFDDVPADHWASQATQTLRDAGIVIGYPNGTFNDTKASEQAWVPDDSWEYQAIDTLQKAGIVIGYPGGTLGGRRRMTRYEFAVAIARLLPLINANAASKSDFSPFQQEMLSDLSQNLDAMEALRWLVVEFSPELTQLKQDVPQSLATLDSLIRQADTAPAK